MEVKVIKMFPNQTFMGFHKTNPHINEMFRDVLLPCNQSLKVKFQVYQILCNVYNVQKFSPLVNKVWIEKMMSR